MSNIFSSYFWLSVDTSEDELGICAETDAGMDSLDTLTELYVCQNYLRDKSKLRIQVGRPNYNSRDLEAATIILSASVLIDEENDEGPPRFITIKI